MNLLFLSKSTRKIVATQLNAYLTKHKPYAPVQSTYKMYHSTETALLDVVNDIMRELMTKKNVF